MQTPLEKLGLTDENAGVFDGQWRGSGAKIDKISPIDGRRLASVRTASDDDYNKAITRAQEAFSKWRVTAAPVRGETVRRLANALREMKHELGQLVTLETGKIVAEGEGEVQGNDRHLRPCRWPVPYALRPDNSIGAAESPADGTMASARGYRGDHRV